MLTQTITVVCDDCNHAVPLIDCTLDPTSETGTRTFVCPYCGSMLGTQKSVENHGDITLSYSFCVLVDIHTTLRKAHRL